MCHFEWLALHLLNSPFCLDCFSSILLFGWLQLIKHFHSVLCKGSFNNAIIFSYHFRRFTKLGSFLICCWLFMLALLCHNLINIHLSEVDLVLISSTFRSLRTLLQYSCNSYIISMHSVFFTCSIHPKHVLALELYCTALRSCRSFYHAHSWKLNFVIVSVLVMKGNLTCRCWLGEREYIWD